MREKIGKGIMWEGFKQIIVMSPFLLSKIKLSEFKFQVAPFYFTTAYLSRIIIQVTRKRHFYL